MIPTKIIFAAGGTAGHIEPALAVARAWRRERPNDECIFLGTSSGLESTLVPQARFILSLIPKVVMPRTLNFDLIKFPGRFFTSIRAARQVISGAKVVVGFGGYVCASAYLAARLEKVPIVIHEANAKVGWANKFGSLFTRHLAITHPVEKGAFMNALITGVPLRDDVQESFVRAARDWKLERMRAKEFLGWNADARTVLIMGGSQGSVSLNAVINVAAPELSSRGIYILHSVGAKNELPQATSHYKPVSYVQDISDAYLAADLVIARSGAVTVAEVGALGRYALFIPLPVGNGEQMKNASQLVEAGRACVVEQENFTAQWLLTNIDSLLITARSAPYEGSGADIDAAAKIVALMDHAISQKGHKS